MTLASNAHGYEDLLRRCFSETVVKKDPTRSKFFSALGIPSYLRDWLVMRFADSQGEVSIDDVRHYVDKNIPRKEQWKGLLAEMTQGGSPLRILAKIRADVDVQTREGLFALPDLSFPAKKYEATIDTMLLAKKHKELMDSNEIWGVIDLEWRLIQLHGWAKEKGSVVLKDFKLFRPYRVDLDYYREARAAFTLSQWLEVLLSAVDYNPAGFVDESKKLAMLYRLLPFIEKRLNIIELAPKGTGKSYLYSQISKYGWLVSGGSLSRARLFYDIGKKQNGLITRYDYVSLDEIQSISFPDVEEMRGALKGYLESGEFRVGDHRDIGEAGLVLLGNISENLMDERRNMFIELPKLFHESALLDRFHGFVRGWRIPRMRENMKANGWALNAEYFSEILHALREDIRYRHVVDSLLDIPRGADTRDTEAVKRLATAFTKLLFPHVTTAEEMPVSEFETYCLKPALDMRGVIRRQLSIMDREYHPEMPEIKVQG